MTRRVAWCLAAAAAALGACRGEPAPPGPAPVPSRPVAPPLEAGPATRSLLSDADRARLEGAEGLEILSVDPESQIGFPGAAPPVPGEARFHGYKVLGSARATPEEQRSLLTALYGGFDKPEPPAACFIPRHALRVAGASGALDFLICFECDTVRVYRGKEDGEFGGTSRAFEPPFDAALVAHGLPKAK